MYQLLSARRSVRKYTDRLVSEDQVDQLIRSILRSPSGNNINPWEVIYLDDLALVESLADAKANGAKFLKGAKQCLVVLADETKTDVWIEDASIAMTIGHLVAADLGLGSCWIQIRERKTASGESSEAFVRRLLSIPEHMRVLALLAFGYPDEEKSGHPEEKLQKEKIYKNGYANRYYK
ncbi:MAG: nitroreductase family protein [Clostridia bacterium]|nr:nitroreductase family protein [Clostridia bacterium]